MYLNIDEERMDKEDLIELFKIVNKYNIVVPEHKSKSNNSEYFRMYRELKIRHPSWTKLKLRRWASRQFDRKI